MEYRFEALCEKEVIVSSTGKKLGYPKDFVIGCECGQVEAILLCRKGLNLFQKELPRIPWCDVERIGEDVIWVCREPGL